jgi:membrane protein YqaA with SNARE-associated domain/outer membrane lipoprotein-sorting protein
MPLFEAFSVWLKATLLPYGGFGLMLLAICDSSFLSLPEVNDILLMTFSIDDPASMPKLALLTTVGSIIGCSLLYAVGRKGGEAFLQKRFSQDRLLRIRQWYQKYGILAIIVPSLLPPPTPFKIFVLSAGTFGISWPRFIVAVLIGRGLRYFSEGFLAVTYGPYAIQFVHQNFGKIGVGLAVAILATVFIYILIKRRTRSVAVMFVLAALTLPGCISRKTRIPSDQRPLQALSKTRAELMQDLEARSNSITTLNARVTLDASGGARKTGILEEYHQTTGLILVERPGQIRMRAQVPVIGTTVFDMSSDGQQFVVNIPFKSKFLVGDPNAPTKSDNGMMNWRPRIILEALFVNILPYLSDPNVKPFIEESIVGRVSYYVMGFLDVAGTEARLLEKIWIDRTDLHVARKQMFGSDGRLETDVVFSDYQPAGAASFPQVITIQRPVDDAALKITFTKTTVNEKLTAEQFVLQQPAGSELVQVDNPRAKPLFK